MKPPSWIGTAMQVFPKAVGEVGSLPMHRYVLPILSVQQSDLFKMKMMEYLVDLPASITNHWSDTVELETKSDLNDPWMSLSLSDVGSNVYHPNSVSRTIALSQTDFSSARASYVTSMISRR